MRQPDPIWVRLRQLREAAGLTREQLAARSGVVRETIRRCERGTSLGCLDTVHRVAAGLGLRVAFEPAGPDPDRLRAPRPRVATDGLPADEVRVVRAVAGERVELNDAERRRVVALLSGRLSTGEIADRLGGVSLRTVQRTRRQVEADQ